MSTSEGLDKKRLLRTLDIDEEESNDNKRLRPSEAVQKSGYMTQPEKTCEKTCEKGTVGYETLQSDIKNAEQIESADKIACDNGNEKLKFKMENINLKENELNAEVKTSKLLAAAHISREEETSNTDYDFNTDKSEDIIEDSLVVKIDRYRMSKTMKDSKSDCEDHIDEALTVKFETSEKENIEIKKERPQSPDVIMLSDEEEDLKNIKNDGNPDSASRSARILKKIKALQNQLRNEEATLVLLKKLRQSQISQPQETTQQVPAAKPQPLPKQQNQQHMRPHRDPPPLVKGTQPISKTLHNATQGSQMWGQQMNNHSPRSQQGPPPLVMVPRAGNGHGGLSQQPSHASHGIMPQNSSRGNDSSRGQQRVQQQQQQQQVTQKPTPVPQAPPPPQDTQTPAQRQAAAKQALRKQLEKTLLQIPPPKPPPPEMNFIPSLACPDFVLLLGLEEVVNHMIGFQLIARGQKNPDERFVCTPFTCVQCDTDFTPVWKREKPGSKNVICEHCVTTNQKKALKQEHTNRLKSAFVKALQQEQEIERMQASTPTLQPSSSNTPQPQHQSAPMISAASAAAAAANAAAAAAVANFRPSTEHLRQHHSFFQQAQLRAGQPLGLQPFSHRSPFPYNIPFAKQQDMQRQYLLDMIPRGNMPWKQ